MSPCGFRRFTEILTQAASKAFMAGFVDWLSDTSPEMLSEAFNEFH